MKATEAIYVTYLRASTESQRDGLGLDAQRTSINNFLSNFGGTIFEEVSEIVSGGSTDRQGFNKALELCRENGAILLVHRIDRLSRSGFYTLAQLEENGVPFIEADSPHDSDLSKNIKFLIAKEEREKIQKRIHDTLAEVKTQLSTNGFYITKEGKRITSLGTPENLTDKARSRSIKVRRAKAISNENNVKAYAVVDRMRENSTFAKMSAYLNKHNFKTSRGGRWYAASVSNLIKLYEAEYNIIELK